ncbi:MAG: hypothetical protein H7831_14125 [Magnetococcus sp. WYHC-3]
MSFTNYTALKTLELRSVVLDSTYVQSVSLCSVYWSSAMRNAYYGSHSHLYDKDEDFHADLTSAKCRVEVSRKPGTRFQIAEHPAIVVMLSSGRLVAVLDKEHQKIPFADPSPGYVSIGTLEATDLLGSLAERYELLLFFLNEEKAPAQIAIPLKKYTSTPNHDGTLSFNESVSNIKLHALFYMVQKLGSAITSLKAGNSYSFNPFGDMQIKNLVPSL